ncbi:MAG: cytochrome bc1 complex diheme cytochrome c subunit [Blastococcus sp.]
MSTTNPQSDAPLDADGSAAPSPAARARARRRSKHRRRFANIAGLFVALILTGAAYSAFAPAQAAGSTTSASSAEAAGQALYEKTCISCHGANLEGVPHRGPSLIGVGEASVYFQVHTGRMPLVREEAEAPEKPSQFTDTQLDQLMAYVQAHGGGPTLPSGDLRDGDLAQGGELFRLNCASCHNFVGEGGSLSSGKVAPSLQHADDMTIYTAMLSGPENMPVFGDNQLTPEQKRAVINYVQTIHAQADPGGAGIGRIGPVSEGLVIWVVGIGAMLFGIFWMGSKA